LKDFIIRIIYFFFWRQRRKSADQFQCQKQSSMCTGCSQSTECRCLLLMQPRLRWWKLNIQKVRMAVVMQNIQNLCPGIDLQIPWRLFPKQITTRCS